ncbi:MAG: hypothetical protein ACK56W_19780 [Pirellula sp.]|jgi:hypothetical protein|nr:hypothetical protein [Pirellula sp.]
MNLSTWKIELFLAVSLFQITNSVVNEVDAAGTLSERIMVPVAGETEICSSIYVLPSMHTIARVVGADVLNPYGIGYLSLLRSFA